MAQHGDLCTHTSCGLYKQHVWELEREQAEYNPDADQPMLRMTSEVMRVGIVSCMFPGALVLCENWVIGFEFSMH